MAFHHLPEPSTGCLKAWLRCHHHPCGGLESCLKRGGKPHETTTFLEFDFPQQKHEGERFLFGFWKNYWGGTTNSNPVVNGKMCCFQVSSGRINWSKSDGDFNLQAVDLLVHLDFHVWSIQVRDCLFHCHDCWLLLIPPRFDLAAYNPHFLVDMSPFWLLNIFILTGLLLAWDEI